MRRWKQQLAVCLCLVLGWSGVAFAFIPQDPKSVSPTYQVIESEIGGNGCANNPTGTSSGTYLCGGSPNYSLNPTVDDGGSSLGETTVGNSGSPNYQTNSGFDTTAQPG